LVISPPATMKADEDRSSSTRARPHNTRTIELIGRLSGFKRVPRSGPAAAVATLAQPWAGIVVLGLSHEGVVYGGEQRVWGLELDPGSVSNSAVLLHRHPVRGPAQCDTSSGSAGQGIN